MRLKSNKDNFPFGVNYLFTIRNIERNNIGTHTT